jgi:ATP-dependent helicase YprA (DUF1998 family)
VQLNCAAKELPFHRSTLLMDSKILNYSSSEALVEIFEGNLRFDKVLDSYIPLTEFMDTPAFKNPIRGIDGTFYTLYDLSKNIIEEFETCRVPFSIYPNAIHSYQGKTYLVKSIYKDHAVADVVSSEYITSPRFISTFDPFQQSSKQNGEINIGMIKYKIKHIGYSKISLLSMKKVDNVDDPLESERELWVYGCWLDCNFQIK